MSDKKAIMSYGFTMKWGTVTYSVRGYNSPQEAWAAIWRGLDAMGYEQPKWWQFWRWGEQIPPPKP